MLRLRLTDLGVELLPELKGATGDEVVAGVAGDDVAADLVGRRRVPVDGVELRASALCINEKSGVGTGDLDLKIGDLSATEVFLPSVALLLALGASLLTVLTGVDRFGTSSRRGDPMDSSADEVFVSADPSIVATSDPMQRVQMPMRSAANAQRYSLLTAPNNGLSTLQAMTIHPNTRTRNSSISKRSPSPTRPTKLVDTSRKTVY